MRGRRRIQIFSEIEKLGEKCKDAGEFEAEFSKSPLNQKYMDLFTEIATKSATKNVVKGAVVGVAQSAAEQALRNVVPTRAAVHQKAYDEAHKGLEYLSLYPYVTKDQVPNHDYQP